MDTIVAGRDQWLYMKECEQHGFKSMRQCFLNYTWGVNFKVYFSISVLAMKDYGLFDIYACKKFLADKVHRYKIMISLDHGTVENLLRINICMFLII